MVRTRNGKGHPPDVFVYLCIYLCIYYTQNKEKRRQKGEKTVALDNRTSSPSFHVIFSSTFCVRYSAASLMVPSPTPETFRGERERARRMRDQGQGEAREGSKPADLEEHRGEWLSQKRLRTRPNNASKPPCKKRRGKYHPPKKKLKTWIKVVTINCIAAPCSRPCPPPALA